MVCHDIFLHLLKMLEARKVQTYNFPQYPSVLSSALMHFFLKPAV